MTALFAHASVWGEVIPSSNAADTPLSLSPTSTPVSSKASPGLAGGHPWQTSLKPTVVTLTLPNGMSQDMEILQWPDGSFSLPVKTMAALFGIDAQQSDAEQRLFFVDPLTQKRVDLYWEQQSFMVNDQATALGKHPLIHSTDGLLVPDDVYLDQDAFGQLFDANFTFDNDATTLTLQTKRKLKTPSTATASDITPTDANTTLIRNPEVVRGIVEKFYIHNTSLYNRQESLPAPAEDSVLYSMVDAPSVKLSGTLFGQEYHVSPSFTRYNTKFAFQGLDWSIQHAFKPGVLSLGSTDAGLSPLTSPTLNVWGLKWASHNALTPFLTPKTEYEFSGKAATGNAVTFRLNDRVIQTVVAQDNAYEFEPVTLQAQTMNHLQIVEKDAQNRETIVLDQKRASFYNLLPKGEWAYSAFAGRRPVRFYPVLPDTKTPIFLPQSEKWLAGGRLFYGLGNRLTLGVAGAADHIWGQPKTYFGSINPFSPDLNGFNSYLRDPNFLSGENLSLTMRYQMTDRWQLSLDSGFSHLSLKPGSLLSIPNTNTGRALQLHLEHQGDSCSWFADLFHYDPYYYTPSVNLYGNALYDRQGGGLGIRGTFRRLPSMGYNVGWSHYRTNLDQVIPGGFINADRLNATLNARIFSSTNVGLSLNGVKGFNRDREFLQRSMDVFLQTRALPWGLTGEVFASHYFTNTLFYPSASTGNIFSESPYTNNILSSNLDIPLVKSRRQHIKVGNQLSTFVNYGFIQGFFQWGPLFCEPLIQRSYGDRPQRQNRLGLRVGYEFKSGSRLSVSYFKNDSIFRSPTGATSSNNTHQFYMDFTDILGLLARRPQSLGPNAETQAIITGTVFVDYLANNQRDQTEPGVRGVKLMVDKQQVALTDKKGAYSLTGLSNGYHTIEVLPDDLPLTLSTENPIYKVKLTEGKTHRVNIGLLHEGGVVKGRLSLVNYEGKPLDPKGFILVLANPSNGHTISYTSVDEHGLYKFSNIPAGHYQVDLEQKTKTNGRYRILQAPPPLDLKIPAHYDESNEVPHQDFQILAL